MNSLNFSWKKKAVVNLQAKSALRDFETSHGNEEGNIAEADWQTLLRKKEEMEAEQPMEKCRRLYDQGVTLAEEERYWEAIKRWDEALKISSTNERIYEMKSQVLMELGEIFPAVKVAERAVRIKPNWAEAYQTLGRSQLNVGKIHLAMKCFEIAKHLKPDDSSLWEEDMKWTRKLIKEEMVMMSMS